MLDRKLGIPISLGVIQMELARRMGVPLEGVSFPGHFLVRLPVDGGLLVLDPYHKGRSVDADELKSRAKPHLNGSDIDDSQLLQILAPASNRAILMRMLVDGFLHDTASMGSPGVDEVKWLAPVRPDDELTVRTTVLDTRVSQSRPDRGFIKFQYDVANAKGVQVMTLTTSLMIARRTQA